MVKLRPGSPNTEGTEERWRGGEEGDRKVRGLKERHEPVPFATHPRKGNEQKNRPTHQYEGGGKIKAYGGEGESKKVTQG